MSDAADGFMCKSCGRFYTDADVAEWDTKWETRDGEDWLIEIIHRCPLCGGVRGAASLGGEAAIQPVCLF